MDIKGIFYWVIVLAIILMAFGLMFRLISLKGFLKWGIILAFGGSLLINIGAPYYYQLYSQYGNLIPFLAICAVIVVIMFQFGFTKQILASTIGSFLYNDIIRRILYITGALVALWYFVDKLAKWIMEK